MKTFRTIAIAFGIAILAQIVGVSFAAPFPTGVGGTGTSITPASGTILIGNGAGSYTPAFLTPGTNITIANASGSVTINAAGGGAITISPVTGASTTFSIIGDGTFFKVSNPSGNTIEVQPATTSIGIWANNGLYLIAANNLSDLTSTSSARANLGLGTAALQNAGFFLIAGNNLSDLTSTSTARTNIGYSGVANQITISGTGGIGFATTSISQFVNDKGYLTSAPATSTLIAGGTATGPAITIATSTASKIFNFNCTASTCTLTIPPFSDYLASSTVYVSSVNGNSGAVTITSSSLGVVPFVLTNINGTASTTFNIVAGAGITSTVSGATTTFTLNLGAGCTGNNFVSTISPTGTITCATPSGGASSTNVFGTAGVNFVQVGVNATGSLDTTYAASWSALETFLKGATINGTTTLASTTNGYIGTNASGVVVLELTPITTTTGNWQGTWQLKNPSDFLASSTTYVVSVNGASGAVTGVVTTGTTITAGGTATGNSFTIATTTASGKFNWNCTGSTCTQTFPSNVGYFTNDVGYVTSTGTGVSTTLQFFVAASNAPAAQKLVAQYTCASTSDDTCIQSAINAASSTGGLITLSGGTFGYQISGVATSVKEFYNNIVIQGQGDGITNWTSIVSSTPLLQVGSYQNSVTGQLTNVGLTGINFTMGTQSSSVAAVKFDGLGNGSYITNNTTNYGGYGFQMEDFDRVNVINNIHNNPFIAGEWYEEGLANTYGNVFSENNTDALLYPSSTDVLVSADADEGSPAVVSRMTFLTNTWHSNNGVASTTGIEFDIPARDTTLQNNLFESDTWGAKFTTEDHITFDSNHYTNNNPFSATSSIDCVQLNNTGSGAGNPYIVVQGTNDFSDCVNAFRNIGSGYPALYMDGGSKNDGNVTNLFVNAGSGGWSFITGTDVNFAGDNTLTDGFSNARYANGYFNNLTASSTNTQNLTVTAMTGGPNCVHETNGVLSATGSDCGSGGSTNPGGNNTTVQFNNGGSFGGFANLTVSTTTGQFKYLGQASDTPGSSISTGGEVNITNGTDTEALDIYDGGITHNNANLVYINETSVTSTQGTVTIAAAATSSSPLNVRGSGALNRGIIKIDGLTTSGQGDANGSGLAIDTAENGSSTRQWIYLSATHGDNANFITGINSGTTEFSIASSGIPTFNNLGSGIVQSTNGTLNLSSLSQSAGTTYINGSTPIIDGGGNWIGNVIQSNSANIVDAASLVWGGVSGNVSTFNATQTITSSTFCGTNFGVAVNTTSAITLTFPSVAAIQQSACNSGFPTQSFTMFQNESTNTVSFAAGASETIEFAPGTPSSMAPGTLYTQDGGYATSTTGQSSFIFRFTQFQTSTPLTVNGNSVTLPSIAVNSFLATDANHNIIATGTPSGGSGFTDANASSGIAITTSTTKISIQNTGVTSITGGAYTNFTNTTGTVTANVSSTLASSTVSFIFQNATTTKPYSFADILTNTAKTISYVDCFEYAAATTTMELYYNTTNASSGIQTVILSSIACGIKGATATSFSTASLPANAYLFAIVSSTAGTPQQTTLNISAFKQ